MLNAQINTPSSKGANPHDSAPLPLLVEQLALAEERLEIEKKNVDAIRAAMARRVADAVAEARAESLKTEGRIRCVVEGCEVVSDVPKKVTWDEKILDAAAAKIAAMNEDPHRFIDWKASVSERKFEVLPAAIRQLIEPARTMSHGKEKIEITLIENN